MEIILEILLFLSEGTKRKEIRKYFEVPFFLKSNPKSPLSSTKIYDIL